MYTDVTTSNIAKDLAKHLKITNSEEGYKKVLKLSATTFIYQFLSSVAKFKKGVKFLKEWCREVERISPFELLAFLLKGVPLVREIKEIANKTYLTRLAPKAVEKVLKNAFEEDETWVKFLIKFFAKNTTYTSTVVDTTILPLHWYPLFERQDGTSAYKISGVGIYEGFKRRDLVRKPFVGFFSLVKTDPEVSLVVRSAVKNYSCLSIRTVKVFGTGKLERVGSRRGSPITKENIIRGPEFQKVATTPFVPEKKLFELGKIENLPFDFSNVLWGPLTVTTETDIGKVVVSSEFPHPLIPTLDWPTSKILSTVNEFPYVPVATLVNSKVKVLEKLPLVWFHTFPSKRTKVLVSSPSEITNIQEAQAVVAVEFKTTGTNERFVVYFPSTKAWKLIGASALDAIRIPCDFAEAVLSKVENASRSLGVLLWLEPLIPMLDETSSIPRWGVYYTDKPSEFTGGVESVYLRYTPQNGTQTLRTVRSALHNE